MNVTRPLFLEFCSKVTGYSQLELEATGLVDLYQDLWGKILGPKLADFYGFARSLVGMSSDREQTASLLTSSVYWPAVSSLIGLWYLGSWTQLPNAWYAQVGLPVPGPTDAGSTHTPAPIAYIEQLSYRTADAHTPGTKPTGFGSWGLQPVV